MQFIYPVENYYETIITNNASGNLKDIKYFLNKIILEQFNVAIKDR